MNDHTPERLPPGTVKIEDVSNNTVILQPRPSGDPEQPLNWSNPRKAINFAIVCFYTLMTFVILDIGTVVWSPMNQELGISFIDLNNSFAANTAGLAVGCILLIPIAIIYGRRPLYIFSTAFQLGCAIWQAKLNTTGELIGANVIGGIGGAVSESIVQMTIADMFFVHQRATMNAVYLFMVNTGAFLAPIAAGYAAVAQGWRWIWWWTAIFLVVALVLMVFFYEETKFVPRVMSLRVFSNDQTVVEYLPKKQIRGENRDDKDRVKVDDGEKSAMEFPKKTLRERFALITLTPGGSRSYFSLIWEFVYLLRFPAVAYSALIYGSSLAWFSVIITTVSTYFPSSPYNFGPSQVGLLSLPPFLGGLIALFVSASNDWIILKLAKRNGGIFEPEMRLWLALPAVFLAPAGMLLFGLTMAEGHPWIVPCIGSAIFGFGFNLISDCSLTYLQDCYNEVIGDALVSIAFFRNGLGTMVVFTITPWIESLGLYNMFISASCIAWALYLTTIPMVMWGRKWRASTADMYEQVLIRNGKGHVTQERSMSM